MASSVIAGTGTAVVGNPVGKSTRRAWWNSYQQRWDGLLSAVDGDHFIVEEIDGTASFTTIELEDRGSARPTIYWDDANKKLYCASRHSSSSQFWIMDYDEGGDEYTFDVGVSGTGITIPGITDAAAIMSMTVTPNGDAWIFLLTTAGLEMQHYDGTSFESSVTVIDTNPSALGCTDCSWFEDGGTNYVCVYATENAGATGDHFFLFIDENNVAVTTPGNWTDESSSIPGPSGGAEVDDHCCLTKDSNHNIYGIYKQEGANDDLRLWKRTPTGTFSGTFQVWAGADGITRPAIGIKKKDSSSDEELFAVAPQTGVSGDDIWYKISPLDTISFDAGKGTSIINEGTDNFSDSMIWQSDFIADSDSGVLVVATNLTDQTRWKGLLVIAPVSGGGTTVVLTGQESTAGQGAVTITAGVTFLLGGQESTAEQGTVTATGAANLILGGLGAVSAQGSITVVVGGAVTVSLVGLESTGGQGVVKVLGEGLIKLTGLDVTAGQGTITVDISTPPTIVTLAGQEVISGQGTISVISANIISLGGQESGAQQGIITVRTGDVWTIQPNSSTTWTIQ